MATGHRGGKPRKSCGLGRGRYFHRHVGRCGQSFTMPLRGTVDCLFIAAGSNSWSSSPPALPAYANTELSLTAVAAMSTISFGGALTAGAVFNGTIYYTFEPP